MVQQLQFNKTQTEKLAALAQYYDLAKELMIFGEQADPEHRTLIQPINELRNCLDHLMRVFLVKCGLGRKDLPITDKYIDTNLDKAFGHVYRAAYDILDWVTLTIRESVVNELKDISIFTMLAIMPEYFKTLKPRFEEIMVNEVATLRKEKDVAITDEKNLIKYGKLAYEVKGLSEQILRKKPSLVEYEHKMRRRRRWEYGIVFMLGVVATIVGGFLLNAFG